jgi:hypothetical protein
MFDSLAEKMVLMHPACQVKPDIGAIVLQVDESASGPGVKVDCAPVVCMVPERATSADAELFVVFEGFVVLDLADAGRTLVTKHYSTNFAYFRYENGEAYQALGGHFDFTPNHVAHPRAHMQLSSNIEMFEKAKGQFRLLEEIDAKDPVMAQVLHRVRTPTAQMDVFSFMVQVAADHLVNESSNVDAVQAFESLVASCAPLQGFHQPGDASCECQRITHWYS